MKVKLPYFCISCKKDLKTFNNELKEGSSNIIKTSKYSVFKNKLFKINICDSCLIINCKELKN